jgi:hypothetical protein
VDERTKTLQDMGNGKRNNKWRILCSDSNDDTRRRMFGRPNVGDCHMGNIFICFNLINLQVMVKDLNTCNTLGDFIEAAIGIYENSGKALTIEQAFSEGVRLKKMWESDFLDKTKDAMEYEMCNQ